MTDDNGMIDGNNVPRRYKQLTIWMLVATALICMLMSGFYLEDGVSVGEAEDSGEDSLYIDEGSVAIGVVAGLLSTLTIGATFRIERKDKTDLAFIGIVAIILMGIGDLFVLDIFGPAVISMGFVSLVILYLFSRETAEKDLGPQITR